MIAYPLPADKELGHASKRARPVQPLYLLCMPSSKTFSKWRGTCLTCHATSNAAQQTSLVLLLLDETVDTREYRLLPPGTNRFPSSLCALLTCYCLCSLLLQLCSCVGGSAATVAECAAVEGIDDPYEPGQAVGVGIKAEMWKTKHPNLTVLETGEDTPVLVRPVRCFVGFSCCGCSQVPEPTKRSLFSVFAVLLAMKD